MRTTPLIGLVLGLVCQSFSLPAEQLVVAPGTGAVIGSGLNLEEMRLVQFAESEEPRWISELDKIKAKAEGKQFFDVTETPDLGSGVAALTEKDFGTPKHRKQVKKVLKVLSTQGLKDNLEKFTSFYTRYYFSDSGRDSQQWLLSKIQEVTAEYASPALKELISINEFRHSWGQNSIILKIAGSNVTSEGGIVLGAHQDCTTFWPLDRAPGADDDGTGTVTILEAYRVLVANNFTPLEDVWFHWYAAEEGGLLGSQAVVKDFKERNVTIKAMAQFDMTAWVKRGTREEVGIITDFVDPSLTNFNKKLVDEYLSIPYVETKCNFACSDHASWLKAGYRVAFSFESAFENINPWIHSANDRIDISDEFSFDHMLEFSKLAVAFAIELGGWKQ